MSPALVIPEPSFTVTPIEKGPKEKSNFGAIITGVDLNNLSDSDIKALKEAVWTHKLVVIKDQQNLDPKKQWELVTRFDPDAEQVHSHGSVSTFAQKGGMLSRAREVVGIPGAENVRLIAKGYQGADHYGLKDVSISRRLNTFHKNPPSDEDFAAGNTRFQRWHIDAPLYEREPAWFTTLRCIKQPVGPDVTVNWDDGSGMSMKSRPGRTAFFSNVQTYELMTPEEQKMADHSWVEYAPYPYQWMQNCHGNANGLGLETEGLEMDIKDLGDFEDSKIKRYPMVWVNPHTGEKAFQVHGNCARKLFVRKDADSDVEVIEDVPKIREFLHKIQSRIVKPEYIVMAPVENGDVAIWDNYQMFHSAVDYPESMGTRTHHQANIGASKGPVGPVPIPVAA
jgi:alpha-ketoglutarate-dependent taurine dioxygenase